MNRFPNRGATAASAGALIGAGMLMAAEAGATYSGVITRSVCMAGAMVPRNADRDAWDNDVNTTCASFVRDGVSNTNFHWARLSIPVERSSSTTTIIPSVRMKGGASGNGQVCAQLWVSDASGNLSTGASTCSKNPFAFQTLSPGALTLPIDGAVLMDIAGQNESQTHVVSVKWTANGT